MRTTLLVGSLLFAPCALANEAAIGESAPSIELTNLDGKTVKLEDYKGKTVVLECA